MKKNVWFLVILFPFLLSSCSDDSELDTTDAREFLVDTWRCTELGASGISYDVSVTLDPEFENRVLLENFHELGYGEKLYAVLENNVLLIPEQTIFDHVIEGEGAIAVNQKTIDWDYSVDDGSGQENFTSRFGEVVVTKSIELIAEN